MTNPSAGVYVFDMGQNSSGWAELRVRGPRGAVIMTTDEDKGQLLDAAVFPGEQGGPHVNKFAAMAVAFKIESHNHPSAVEPYQGRSAPR